MNWETNGKSNPDLMNVEDVAKHLRISRSTVYALVERGILRCYRIGANGRGTLRFTQKQLEDYLREAEAGEPVLDLD